MVLGEIGNFSAYGFSPASLVAPLGTTTVIGMLGFSCLSLITKMNGEEKSVLLHLHHGSKIFGLETRNIT